MEEARTLWAKPGSQMIKESSILPRSSKPKLKCFFSLACVPLHQFTPEKMAAKSVFLPVATCSKSKQIRNRYHRLQNSSADFILAVRQVKCLTLKHLDLNFLMGEKIKSLLVIPVDIFTS